MRQFNETETQALLEAEKLLKEQGLSNDERNLEIILDYFDKNPTTAVTAQMVLWLANHDNVKPHLKWLTPAQKAWADLNLSAQEFEVVQTWLKSQRGLIALGNEGVENALACTKWVKDRNYTLNAANLQHAVTNITNNGKVRLHWTPVRQERPELLHNHAKDPVAENPKPDPRYRPDGRLNHSLDPTSHPKQSESSIRTRLDAEAKSKAESVKGKTHAATETISKIFVTDSQNNINWQATYEARVRAANPNPGIVSAR